MQDIQEVFNKMQKAKKEQVGIRKMYKDSLSNFAQYKEIVEQLNQLKEKKKQIENTIKSEFKNEFEKLEQLKNDADDNKIMLSDIALTKLIKGENVEVKDEYDTKYEPVFTVNFKKA